jgi:hypothetical protein
MAVRTGDLGAEDPKSASEGWPGRGARTRDGPAALDVEAGRSALSESARLSTSGRFGSAAGFSFSDTRRSIVRTSAEGGHRRPGRKVGGRGGRARAARKGVKQRARPGRGRGALGPDPRGLHRPSRGASTSTGCLSQSLLSLDDNGWPLSPFGRRTKLVVSASLTDRVRDADSHRHSAAAARAGELGWRGAAAALRPSASFRLDDNARPDRPRLHDLLAGSRLAVTVGDSLKLRVLANGACGGNSGLYEAG